jgi:small ligand-binding sensory domain FIST
MEITARDFRVAHAGDGEWRALVEDCIEQLGDVPPSANLGFLYVTDALDESFERISERLREATGVKDWVGTIGFGVCVGGREYFDRPAMVALVCSIPDDDYRLMPTVSRPGEALANDIPEWVENRHPLLGVVHGDPRNAYLTSVIDSVCDDTNCYLVGGLTASRGQFDQLAGSLTQGGLSGVLFADSVNVASGLTQGCSPIGDIHEVTAARDNVLIELDARPALDVFKEDIGEVLARNIERIGGYIHAALPISGTDNGDYLVRNIMGIDPQKNWMSIGDRLEPGNKLMFVRRDGASALADLERMLDDVTHRAAGRPKAALYFSCVARGPNLFGANSEELKAVAAAIGDDVPLVGFYANGEISNNRVYGYTGVLTLFL